ncbi:MAG: DUF2442 domain-containing protein [Sulfurospirillum sp.]|nr:DUF2442 domain-containing protein [Sulfurospirillum sp.]
MYLSVINVVALEDYKLLLTFENGEKKIFDVTPYLKIGRFSELKNCEIFKSVRVHFDSVEWSNKLDLDPELLYTKGIIV